MRYQGISIGEQGCGIGDIIEGNRYDGTVDEGWTITMDDGTDVEVFYIFVIENNQIVRIGGI